MASMGHEVLVDLFKNRPSLGAELLSEALAVALPTYTEARLISIDLTQIRPAEYRADVVVLLLDGDVPIWVLIVEVQLGIDPRKRFTWPEYSMGSRAAHVVRGADRDGHPRLHPAPAGARARGGSGRDGPRDGARRGRAGSGDRGGGAARGPGARR
jgi:hypothetical protein